MNILVVDDDQLVREMTCRMIGYTGHTAIGACNGKDALGVIYRRVIIDANLPDIDLVISDCDMPVMSGPEMLATLKGDPAFARVPVIMMSGNSDHERNVIALGAIDFMSKPFSTDVLIEKINRALAQGRE